MKIKMNKEMPSRRSVEAASLRNFRANTFHHKCADRGGAVNGFSDLLSEVAENREIEMELALLQQDAE